MDQSKWAVPRDRLLQSTKQAQGLQKPKMKVQGVWLHGVDLSLYVIHPAVPADSSLVTECLQKSLERAAVKFQERGVPFPSQFMAWAPCMLLLSVYSNRL